MLYLHSVKLFAKTSESTKGMLSLISAALLYSVFGMLLRTVGYEIPQFYANVIRSIVATALFLPLLFIMGGGLPKLTQSDWVWVLLRTVSGNISIILFSAAVNHLPINVTYFIFYGGSTIGGYIIGRMMIGEKITRLKYLALTLALVGLGLVYHVTALSYDTLYLALAFLCGISTAFWNISPKKLKASLSDIQLSFLDSGLSIIMCTIFSLLFHETWNTPTLSPAWIANTTIGVLFVVTGIQMVYGFRRLDAQIGSIVMLSEILFAVIASYLLYNEVLTLSTFVGGMFIILAIVLPEINWKPKKKSYAHRR